MSMVNADEHAAVEWAEFNLPEYVRALPPQASPLGRRVIARQALSASRQALAAESNRDPFWFFARRPI